MTEPKRKLKFKPAFATPGLHPYDELQWSTRTAKITEDTGKVVFEQTVEVPTSWSDLATKIAASKYFYGDIALGEDPKTGGRETSARQLIDRVVNTITQWGINDGYFAGNDAAAFKQDLKWLCINQHAAFNSPVWFNVGLFHQYGVGKDSGPGNYIHARVPQPRYETGHELGGARHATAQSPNQYEFPQASACFINSVQDNMESIMALATAEVMLFKYGSGTGTNLSTLRSSREKLTGGGKPSGPLSFLKGYDAFAGIVKSGGKTRRAAKMNILSSEHPDIEEFIDAKSNEEKKAWALIAQGYDGSFNGEAYGSVAFQNENLSVRVSDEFMNAAVEGREWWTKRVTDGKPCEKKDARTLLRKIAEGTYLCGDPGMQFDDTIHKWHTCKGTGRQMATNPCSEYLFLDDTACNLSSLNLLKFKAPDGSFDVDRFRAAVCIMITAQEILVDNASYPTRAIAANSHIFRTLGLGYANLGALLMSMGLGYDSDEGRALAGSITAVMTGEAYSQSAKMAEALGAFPGYHDSSAVGFKPSVPSNEAPMFDVISLHRQAVEHIESFPQFDYLKAAARDTWITASTLGVAHGYRNAQVTVLAPTGTIGFLMDCDTTGIEPAISLVAYKTLAGGGMLKIVNQTVERALTTLGYDDDIKARIIAHIEKYDTIEDVDGGEEFSGLRPEHLSIFDCAFKAAQGTRSLHYMGHIRMMAAAQPFLSGAISKTVNLPAAATVEDIMNTYIEGWRAGLKAIAIYRDGSKASAPLSASKTDTVEPALMSELIELRSYIASLEDAHEQPLRRRMPVNCDAKRHKFEVAGHEGYLHIGLFPDGTPGELFIQMAKEGSTIGGLMDTIGTLTSVALQYGVPLENLVKKFAFQRFEPSGFTHNPDIRNATSLIDYVFRFVGCEFIEGYRNATSAKHETTEAPIAPVKSNVKTALNVFMDVVCSNCGSSKVIRAGACGCCTECGTSQGCS
jgi:ribonucleoside-diphosphate reductase alpha chain